MAQKLRNSVGLIVANRNYVLLREGESLPINERHLDMGFVGGDVEIQVTVGDSDKPSEVTLLGRGILKVPKRDNKTKLIVTLSADEDEQIRLYMNDTASGKDREDFFLLEKDKNSVGQEAAKSNETVDAGMRSNQPNDTDGKIPVNNREDKPLSARIEKRTERQVNEEIEERFLGKHLIGLSDVKRDLSAQYNTLLMSEDFRRNGSGYGELLIPWNFFIGGGSGSGKHTIAKIISELLYDNGMTDRKEPLITNAISIDASKPSEFFEQIGADGRTVIIENTELLVSEEDEERDNAKLWLFISAVLEAANERQDCFYVFLGTKDAMEKQMRRMPRLARSVTPITIPEYDVEELKTIAGRFISEQGFLLDTGAEDIFDRTIRSEAALPGFAGANALKVLIRDAVKRKSFRYMDSGEQNKLLIAQDFVASEDSGETLEELLNQLDNMTGLSRVKREVREEIEAIRYEKLMRGAGKKGQARSLHMMFLGNPGTGKTVTARLIAKIYGKLGLLPKPDLFIEADRSSLIGAYQGHSEKATKELIGRAMGGVLFIDEAHRLVSGDQDDYGKQALGVLIKNMEDYRDRFMVILAGYDNMEQVLSQYEPGITRRISKKLHFDDYSQEELFEIFTKMLGQNEPPMVLDEDAKKEAITLIRERSAMQNFGNAGGVRNIADEVTQSVKTRLVKEYEAKKKAGEVDGFDPSTMSTIPVLTEDIAACGRRESEGITLKDYEQQLDELIGLSRIKEEVRVREDQIRMEQARIRMGEEPSDSFFLHSIFYGNAGTGKTTVARLIGKIYNKLGVLPAGDVFVEVTRSDLVAEYMGQTAIKTKRVVESAIGGVLFIDEAYALCTGPDDTFGMEALNTLLTLAVDYRDRLMIILAGYEEPIKRLINLNQGLERRFPNQFHFEDYSEEELYEIFCYKLKKNSRIIENGASDIIRKVINKRSKRSGFGNAGGIDNIMKELIDAQSVRLRPHLEAGDLTQELFKTITAEDASELLTAGRD